MSDHFVRRRIFHRIHCLLRSFIFRTPWPRERSILSAFSSEYLRGNVFPTKCFVSDLPSPSYNKPPNGALIDVHVTPAGSPVPLFQSETPVSSFSLRTKTQTCTPLHTQHITLSLHFLTHAFLALKSLSLSFSFHMHIFISPEASCLSTSQIMC